MLHRAHNVGRDLQEQLDRQNYITNKDTSHKTDTNKKFLDKGDGRAEVRIKGEVKRGGTEKMKKRQKERERLQFQLIPCRCLFRHQPHASRKGQ